MYLESNMSRVLDIPKYRANKNKYKIKLVYFIRFIHYKLVSYDKQCLPHSSGEFKCRAMLLPRLYILYCRNKSSCPLPGKCLTSSVVYQATVVRNDTNQKESYVGHTEGEFKSRYYCHTSSFKLSKYRNATELSKYIWQLKESKVKYDMHKISVLKYFFFSSKRFTKI